MSLEYESLLLDLALSDEISLNQRISTFILMDFFLSPPQFESDLFLAWTQTKFFVFILLSYCSLLALFFSSLHSREIYLPMISLKMLIHL